MTLPWDFEKSDSWCPRGHGRLVEQVGADDLNGQLSAVRWCLHCDYREEQGRTDKTLRQEIRQALKRRNAAYASEGVLVPMRIDDSPFPEEDWS